MRIRFPICVLFSILLILGCGPRERGGGSGDSAGAGGDTARESSGGSAGGPCSGGAGGSTSSDGGAGEAGAGGGEEAGPCYCETIPACAAGGFDFAPLCPSGSAPRMFCTGYCPTCAAHPEIPIGDPSCQGSNLSTFLECCDAPIPLCDFPNGPPDPPVIDSFCAPAYNDGRACCRKLDQAEIGICINHECNALPAYCPAGPASQLTGPGFSTWINPDCTGDVARGALTSDGLPCAQWHEPGDTEGDVYCADMASPVPAIYFVDPNDGVCKQWVLTVEPWYVWRFCGRRPLP